jgi:hypothetical protein
LVTVTVTVAAASAAVIAVIVVLFTTVMPVAAASPIITDAPLTKPLPVIVTLVPPAGGPKVGLIAPTVGGATKVKQLVQLPDCVSLFVTTALTRPAACAGVVAVIVVALTTVTAVAGVPSIVREAPAVKAVPVIVTLVPPLIGPEIGLIPVTVGGAT